MNRRQIHRFFSQLAPRLGMPARVFLTGAAAGSLWGSVRPSEDIDFALAFPRSRSVDWERVERAVADASKATSIPANFAEDIDRWGMISLLTYKRAARPYRRFGSLEV